MLQHVHPHFTLGTIFLLFDILFDKQQNVVHGLQIIQLE